jgi:hypothetical protein
MLASLAAHGEICLILAPPERTCRRLGQQVASRETFATRK